MGKIDWDIVTNYTDVVTTTLKTVTFPKVQEAVYLRNQGNANFTYTIGSQSGTLTPGQSVTVKEDISSFTLQAVSGTHTFELRANEKGTEKDEVDNNLPSDVSVQLTSITTSLAQKASQTYVDQQITNIGNASPKGTYATLSALQTAFPTGTTGIYLVTADGKWYYWNGSAWTAGGTYQSTGVADGSVTIQSTDFIGSGKNKLKLFPKTLTYAGTTITVYEDKIVINGVIDKTNAAASIVITDNFTYVVNGVAYTLSTNYISGSAPTGMGIGLINASPLVQITSVNGYVNGTTQLVQTKTFTPSNANGKQYFWLTYPASGTFDNYTISLQLEEGSSQTSFEKYYQTLKQSLYVQQSDFLPVKAKTDAFVKVNKVYMDGSKTLRNVLDNIKDAKSDNLYEVYIPEGTYDIGPYYTAPELAAAEFYGLFVPDYVTLIGQGSRENTILTMTFSTASQFISTLNLRGTSGLKNLTVIGNKTRYAIHDDFSYTDTYCYRTVENCVIQGISTYYNSAYGAGTHNGAVWNFKNTKFISNTFPAFSCHTNVGFTIPSDLTFENCKFITQNNIGLKLSSLASGATNRARFYGCHFNGILMQEEVANSGVPFDWSITGHGNSKGFYQVSTTDGNKYMYNFADECPTMIAGEVITKGKPVARNGFYVVNQSTRDISRFFGVAMSDGTVGNEMIVKTEGYVKVSDTTLTTVNVGDKIGITSGDFAVVTTGTYIGICDVSGYFRLI